jgi:CDP-paratose 2-epimerase
MKVHKLAGHVPLVGPAAEIGFAVWPFFGDHASFESTLADIRQLATGRPVMVRLQVSWADWARGGDGPRWLDYTINRCHDLGLEIFPTFMWTPPSFGVAPISSAPPRDLGTFFWFVDHVLARYGHLISPYVQIWNEANGYCYWDRGLDPYFRVFAEMNVGAARIAREDHGKQTVLAGIIPAGGLEWVDLMCRYGVVEHIDRVALHGFPGTWLRRRIGWLHLLERLDAVLARHGLRRPVWICEASYSTARRRRRSLEAEFRQIQMFRKLLHLPVERIFWYTLRDLAEDRRSAVHAHLGSYDPREHGCGLRYTDGTPKMLWNAWRAHGIEGIRSGACVRGPLRDLVA